MLLAVTLTIKTAAVSVAVRIFPTRLDAPAYSGSRLSLRKCESTDVRSHSFKAQSGMGGKGNNGFHAFLEVPKGDKHLHPRFAQLPEIESFAKTEKEKKFLAMWRGFRTAASPLVLPPGTPKDRVEILQEAMRKAFNDPEFRAEFKKLVTDDISTLMPEELMKVIKEPPRDAEVI
jgi:hypothetical protein